MSILRLSSMEQINCMIKENIFFILGSFNIQFIDIERDYCFGHLILGPCREILLLAFLYVHGSDGRIKFFATHIKKSAKKANSQNVKCPWGELSVE